jgi:hypothetical protein
MNYRKIYDNLIDRARNRRIEGYVEIHHVIPRCLGGTDDLTNLVPLTAEEHYVAHQLLVKIYPGVPGLVFACIAMSGKTNEYRNNKLYAWVRKQCSEAAILNRTGKKHSDETKVKMSAWQKGKPKQKASQETKDKMSAARKGRPSHLKGKELSEAHKNKIVESITGRKHSEETKAKMALARKQYHERKRAEQRYA